jgi:hypothetical protein
MDSIDAFRERFEALEQQTNAMATQTRRLARRLRWWRGLSCGLVGLGVLTWALPVVTAGDSKKGLEQRVAALERLLTHFRRDGNEVFIEGANLHIVNGLGETGCRPFNAPIPGCPNGLGNLIVGYNELRTGPDGNIRTGSHNVVGGEQHHFSSFGGSVVGSGNTISNRFAVVSGGSGNTASGAHASVSGGEFNEARGGTSSIIGGFRNIASGIESSVRGGKDNEAAGGHSSVSGGREVVQEVEEGWAAGSISGEVTGSFRSP